MPVLQDVQVYKDVAQFENEYEKAEVPVDVGFVDEEFHSGLDPFTLSNGVFGLVHRPPFPLVDLTSPLHQHARLNSGIGVVPELPSFPPAVPFLSHTLASKPITKLHLSLTFYQTHGEKPPNHCTK
ncbi:hypothetical protein V6N12_037119 [Hibiscus sabdariffa]|uniref:Uncharacterized protein n=1 Tax=Hibiscus sabdariffa TaxID=183260 RepID=A0ABR2ANX7_9ROSI